VVKRSLLFLALIFVLTFTACEGTHDISEEDPVNITCTIINGDKAVTVTPYTMSEKNFSHDKAYEHMQSVIVSGDVSVVFTPDTKRDELIVSEDYYELLGSSTSIKKTTYTLTPKEDGTFVLDVRHRSPKSDEKAIYFMNVGDMRQVFSIEFKKTTE